MFCWNSNYWFEHKKNTSIFSSDFERRKRSIGQNIYINYDDFQAMTTIYYTENPVFEKLSLIEYDKESTILIKVKYLYFFISSLRFLNHLSINPTFNTTGATTGAGPVYPYITSEFTAGF
jgi:hypothetical protein